MSSKTQTGRKDTAYAHHAPETVAHLSQNRTEGKQMLSKDGYHNLSSRSLAPGYFLPILAPDAVYPTVCPLDLTPVCLCCLTFFLKQ